MAESQTNSNLESSKSTIPTNEELINSLVSDVEECVVTEENVIFNTNSINNSNSKSKNDIDSTVLLCENEKVESLFNDDDKIDENTSAGDENHIPTLEDDLIDELALKDRELTYTEEDRKRLCEEADTLKENGNELFKSGHYKESALAYTQALRTCPLAFDKNRAIFYSNRAAAKMKLGLNEAAIEDCTKALELDERYLKTLYRRAQLYEATDKLDEALADYNKILEIDPLHRDALYASKRLPSQIEERNEKMKTEMLGKLKELGNMFLKPFGLSTQNFQMTQDPNSGGYSINFKN